MTEKELFKNAMKQNMKDPAEQSAAEVREGKKNYGYVRSSGIKYAVAAAALAVAVGVGTVLVLNNRDSVPKTDANASRAENIVASAESVKSAEQPSSTEEETAMKVYRDFWNKVKAAPENYWSSVQMLNKEMFTDPQSIRSYWFTEDQIGQPKSGKVISKEIADYFADAENVEYLGFVAEDSDASSELMETLTSERLNKGGVISIAPRAEVEQSGLSAFFMNYQIGRTGAVITLTALSNTTVTGEVVKRNDYFRVTSADWNFPCCENGSFTVPDWDVTTADQAYIMSGKEMKAEDMDHSFRVTDAEDRISFEFSFSVDDSRSEMPVVKISGMTLPEGVSITEGKFSIQLDTIDAYGKSSPVVYPVAITEDIIRNGVTVDLKDFAKEFNKDDLSDVRVYAMFNTNEHTKALHEDYMKSPDDLTYAYTLVGYVGIDRMK